MNLIQITNTHTPQLLIYQQLRDNAFTEDNSFLADSAKVVNMLLETDIEVKSILATQEYYNEFEELIQIKNIPQLFVASKKVMQTIVGHKVLLHWGSTLTSSQITELSIVCIISKNFHCYSSIFVTNHPQNKL